MDHLGALGDALRELGDGPDLGRGLTELLEDLGRAVPSALGLQVTTTTSGQEVTLAHFRPGTGPGDVRTSLEVPLLGGHEPAAVGRTTMVVYAATPGALVDLAADLAAALRVDLDRLRLDGHPPRSTTSGLRGLAEVGLVNRAIGVLIDRGHDLRGAEVELQRQAAAAGSTVVERAQALLDGLPGAPAAPGST